MFGIQHIRLPQMNAYSMYELFIYLIIQAYETTLKNCQMPLENAFLNEAPRQNPYFYVMAQ